MLTALIRAGFTITGTWPLHTERETGLKNKVNALASSIVLVCRPRPAEAPATTRRAFLAELKAHLPADLKKMQAAHIAPVDLAQAAIGPGMAIFSRFSRVLEADGSPMPVRAALQAINAELDAYFSAQDMALDAASRFCLTVYAQHAYNNLRFGEADVLARARNVSVATLEKVGLVIAQKGVVRLRDRDELARPRPEPCEGCVWLLAQHLVRAMTSGGVTAVAALAANHPGQAEAAHDLAYRLFALAERKKWTNEAFAYNALVSAWAEVQQKAAEMARGQERQGTLDEE